MLSIPLPPDAIAALILGETIVVRVPGTDATIEIYAVERPKLGDTVGAAVLDVLPFMGDPQ
jgi:hypothetical protein